MNRKIPLSQTVVSTRVIYLMLLSGCLNNPSEIVEPEPSHEIEEDTSFIDEQSQDIDNDSGGDDTGTSDDSLIWQEDLAVYTNCQAEDREAKLVSFDFPLIPLIAGDIVPGEVVYANCSNTTWIAAEHDDSPYGFKLGAVAETVMQEWSRPRIALPHHVPPNYAVRIRWNGVAPLTNGKHRWHGNLLMNGALG